MGGGQVELAGDIGREAETQPGFLLKRDSDVKLDLMLTPIRRQRYGDSAEDTAP